MNDSPEFRLDPFSGDSILLAPGRAAPIVEDRVVELPAPNRPCPFCPGREADTEGHVARWPAEGTGADWQVRVVRNRYPAVHPNAQDSVHGSAARGAHEVIVEGRAHEGDLTTFSRDLRRLVLRAYQDRIRVHRGTGHVHLFRNRGRRAGSSQPHPHAQMIATAHVGNDAQRRWKRNTDHFARTGRTLLADVLQDELTRKDRIVQEHDAFVVLCPVAPRFNGETWVVPRRGPSFAECEHVDALADLLGPLLRAIATLGRPAYNLVWREPACAHANDPAAFWTLEIMPRRGPGAGYELSAGTTMATVRPEDAAAMLRARVRE
ncbi:MAG: hypothetical protein AAGE52_10930 [Myxococcota bacterium]